MDFKDRMYADVDLADSGYEPVVSSRVHYNELSSSVKGKEHSEHSATISFSRMTPLLGLN
jgi:hypothetical protein